jgi:hypothetical protein
VNPVDVTMALAKGARLQGATIIEGVPVTGVLTRRGAVTGVRPRTATIEAEYVVNCAGMWARQLGARPASTSRCRPPSTTTSSPTRSPGLAARWPVLEDPGSYGYFREEVGGMMVGLFEPVCAPWKVEGIPEDFSFGEIAPDWDRMGRTSRPRCARADLAGGRREEVLLRPRELHARPPAPSSARRPSCELLRRRRPQLDRHPHRRRPRPRARPLDRHGRPDVDVTGFNIDRLHTYQANPEYRRTRTVESLGMVYQCHYPTRSMQTARGAKRSPLHDRLAARGAYFRDVSGWEGADWYAPTGTAPTPGRCRGAARAGSHWRPSTRRRARA